MSRNEVRWERMFPDELEQAFAACPVLYFPYGLCEPHGPHCTLGLDALKAHAIVCQAAREHGGIVAPPDYWHIHEISGYASWAARNIGEVARPWLTALPPWQHFKNVCYHVRAADTLGFQAALFFTGHYGPNWQDLKLLLEIIQPYVGRASMGSPTSRPMSRALTAAQETMRARWRPPCSGPSSLTVWTCRAFRSSGDWPALRDGEKRARSGPPYRRTYDSRRGRLAGPQGAGTPKGL